MQKVVCSWSGGKDSALALYEIMQSEDYDIMALLTTVTKDYGRISMHGVRDSLLEAQARSIGLKLEKVFISKESTNAEYESEMRRALERYAAGGVTAVVFGDIFLEDLRRYREERLAALSLKGVFPIWKQKTASLAKRFIDLGFKAVVTCVDEKALPKEFVGRSFDEKFLSELPKGVDTCGENGEFHSFVYGGPIFEKEIGFITGEIVRRDDRFWFCDLLPA